MQKKANWMGAWLQEQQLLLTIYEQDVLRQDREYCVMQAMSFTLNTNF